MKDTIRIKNILNILPILGLFVYYYTVSFTRILPILFPLGLVALWIVFALFQEGIQKILFSKGARWWLAYMLQCYVMSIIGISSSNINYQIVNTPLFFIPVIGSFVVRNFNYKELRLLVVGALIIYLGNIVQNIFVWNTFPEWFGDKVVNSEENDEFMKMLNIAPTAMVSTSIFILGTFCIEFFCGKKNLLKGMCLSIIILIGFYVFVVSSRATASIFIVIMLLGFILAKKEPLHHKFRYYIINISMICMIGLIFAIPILQIVSQCVDNERLSTRFNDVLSLFQSSGNISKMNEGSFSERLELHIISIKSWLSGPISFLFGIGDHTVKIGGNLMKSGIGGHSEVWDLLGKYGLVGGFIFYKIFKEYYSEFFDRFKKKVIVKYFNIMIAIYLLYGFFNHIIHPITILYMFLIFPVIVKLMLFNRISR